MLGLVGSYDSDSADESPAAVNSSTDQDLKPLSTGGAVLTVKKAVIKSSSNPLFQNYGDDSDSDSVASNSHALPFDKAGVIDIVASPKTKESNVQSIPVSRNTSNPYLSMRLIPPEPPGRSSSNVQEKIVKFLSMDRNFNATLQGNKQFHNPYILDKIAQLYSIEQKGSNYPPDIYDPKEWESHDYERIAKRQEQTLRDRAQAEPQAPAPAPVKTLPSGGASRWDSGPVAKKVKTGPTSIQSSVQQAYQIANQLKASLSAGAIGEAASAAKKEAVARAALAKKA